MYLPYQAYLFFFFIIIISPSFSLPSTKNTIIFTTLGRSRYNFDIFSTSTSHPDDHEIQLTDGISVNYNGFFNSNSSSLIFISERNGQYNIYLTSYQSPIPFTYPLLNLYNHASSMKDRPSISGYYLIYVSTHQPSPFPRQSWTAVYSTHLTTGETTRLTPYGVADFSPSVSPSGYWTAVASSGVLGWSGEIEELNTSIYVFKTSDGQMRTKLIEHGGWPCWADDNTLYFHRKSEDGWWSVYRATVSTSLIVPVVLSVDRITPPGFHAFTPAANLGNPGIIAVATRREGSEFRHIELVDVRHRHTTGSNVSYVEVTGLLSPYAHHYNPFMSSDGTRVGYHRCRGGGGGDDGENGSPPLWLENIKNPYSEMLSLFRIDGSFSSFSPDGRWIAYVELNSRPGLSVKSSSGSGAPRKVLDGMVFATAWDWKRKGVIYTSFGPIFSSEGTKVDIVSVTIKDEGENSETLVKKLTSGGENNAFPSPSPDGKWVVFRSGRSGHKNLYIMDAIEGESSQIHQLTEGPWTDTMCNWSPDGEWIVFASDRDHPGSGSFAIYMVHPNRTGLRKVVHSGYGGRTNHPWFSPDSKRIVFTSDYGGVSAEPISNPHHFQPYGDIFTANIDGSDIQRLTHNSYEDGTPSWSSFSLKPEDVAEDLEGSSQCGFDDCHFLEIKKTSSYLNNVFARAGC